MTTKEKPDHTVESIARSLPDRLRPEEVEGWETTFHYKIPDAEKSEWTVRIAGGACTVEEGLQGAASCVVQMREATFLKVETGALNPQAAYMMGKVKVSNLAEMMRFLKAFRPLEG